MNSTEAFWTLEIHLYYHS